MTRHEKEKNKITIINDIKMIEAVLKMEKDMINSELYNDFECEVLKEQIQTIKQVVNNLIM